MPRKKGKDLSPGLRARQYLLDHPHDSNQEVAEAIRVGLRTVSYARSHLIKEGIVPPTYFDRTIKHRAIQVADRVKADPDSKLNQFIDPPINPLIEKVTSHHRVGKLTTEESLDMLADFARHARDDGNFPLAKDAIVAYNRIEATSTETQLGPPPPQTDKDKVSRTTSILDVVGPTIAAHAAVGAFITNEDRDSFEEEFARQSVTHPPTKEDRTLISTGDSPTNEGTDDKTNQSEASEEVDPGHAKDTPNIPTDLPLSEESR